MSLQERPEILRASVVTGKLVGLGRMAQQEEPALVYSGDPVVAAAMAKDYRQGVLAALAEVLPPELFRSLTWAKNTFYPAISSLRLLDGQAVCGLERLDGAILKTMLWDDSGVTEVERGDGIMPGVSRAGSGGGVMLNLSELTKIFAEAVAPAALAPATRVGYLNGWRQVVTFALAHDCVGQILPMSKQVLQGLTVDLLLAGVSANTIKNVWSAVQHRHDMAGIKPPLAEPRAFQKLFKAVASITGTPGQIQFPIGTHHIQQWFELVGLSTGELRAVLSTVLGTTACSRPVEVSNMQLCDLLWGHDGAFHVMLAGGLAIRIYKRKQDTGRFGLYVRIPDSPLVAWLKRWITSRGLRKSPRCTKGERPGARCQYCDPVFPRLVSGRAVEAVGQTEQLRPMSRQQVSAAVKTAVGLLGLDSRYYSGKSMRRGGITAAVQARVPEPILYLQSGHGTAKSGRRYVDPVDPRILYATGAAILGTRPLN